MAAYSGGSPEPCRSTVRARPPLAAAAVVSAAPGTINRETSALHRLLTLGVTRAIFDRYHIVHEQELLAAGDQLAAYLAQPARRAPLRSAGGPWA